MTKDEIIQELVTCAIQLNIKKITSEHIEKLIFIVYGYRCI